MKKKIYSFIFVTVLLLAVFNPASASSFVMAADAGGQEIKAYLFLSDSCPWCRKLKQEGFAAKFRQKYAGRITLKEYEIHTPEGSQLFNKMIKKYKLRGGVPTLIVGDTALPGYSENMLARAEEAVEKESKKPRLLQKTAASKASTLPAVMSITMDDEDLHGVAPAKEMKQIKQYLTQVQEENGETLSSMNSIFNASVCNQAIVIVNTHEQKLKNLASKSTSFAAFKKSAATVKAAQEKQLAELMQKNAKALR